MASSSTGTFTVPVSQLSPLLHSTLFASLIAILLWSPLPYGSDHFVFWSLFETLTFFLAACWLIAVASGRIDISPALLRFRWPLILLSLFTLWCWVQATPLGLASAASERIYKDAGVTARLSVDTAASFDTFLKSLCYTLLFGLTLALADTQARVRQLCLAIVVMAAFQACYGSLMVLSGVEHSFFAEKEFYRNTATGTFINRNHLAGYLELAGGLGIGLLVAGLNNNDTRGWRNATRQLVRLLLSQKLLVRLLLAVIVIGLVMTRSRMGNVAFFSSMSGCGLLYLLITRNRSRGALLLFGSLLLIDLLIVGNFFGVEQLAQRLEQTSTENESRDEVVRDSLPIIQDFPITGTGGGTFVAVFQQYSQEQYGFLYDHAHNDFVQFAVEFGLIGCALLVLLVFYALWQAIAAMLQRREALMRGLGLGCTIGIIALMIHSATDFNLQIPANAALFVVVLALACLSRLRLPTQSIDR